MEQGLRIKVGLGRLKLTPCRLPSKKREKIKAVIPIHLGTRCPISVFAGERIHDFWIDRESEVCRSMSRAGGDLPVDISN
jgi:hypothetical protein